MHVDVVWPLSASSCSATAPTRLLHGQGALRHTFEGQRRRPGGRRGAPTTRPTAHGSAHHVVTFTPAQLLITLGDLTQPLCFAACRPSGPF